MMATEEDFINAIQRKVWTVEQLASEASELLTMAKHLLPSAKQNIPAFTGDWSEEALRKFFGQFAESIRDPLRHANRKLLAEHRVETKGIPGQVFEDSKGIRETLDLLDEVAKFNKVIADILMRKGVLANWMSQGTPTAKEGLQKILDARTALERIAKGGANGDLIEELLHRSVLDISFIPSAEDVTMKVKFTAECGISMSTKDFDSFRQNLEKIYAIIKSLVQDYKIGKHEIIRMVEGRPTDDLIRALQSTSEESAKKRDTLLAEWKMLASTLSTIGSPVSTLITKGLNELEADVGELKAKCLHALGDDGMKLLSFLRGEIDFPDDIPNEGVKKALHVLRPLIMASLRREAS